jgi:hypothetical protein
MIPSPFGSHFNEYCSLENHLVNLKNKMKIIQDIIKKPKGSSQFKGIELRDNLL